MTYEEIVLDIKCMLHYSLQVSKGRFSVSYIFREKWAEMSVGLNVKSTQYGSGINEI